MNYHTGPWTLEGLRNGLVGLPNNGLRVFSCFSGGGGSSMGYRLAGYNMVGFCEIDEKMAATYLNNMSVARSFIGSVTEVVDSIGNLELDVLDGSPPCSSFSMAGRREKDWGVERKFAEGQALQILDDLFFHFIDVANRLRPKVIVAENVKGLIIGKAQKYVTEIFLRFKRAGYTAQLFLLNASYMGVPQARERTVFIATRDDLHLPKMSLIFNESKIGVSAACIGADANGIKLTKRSLELWKRTPPGVSLGKAHPKGHWFSHCRSHPYQTLPTITAQTPLYHWAEPRYLSDAETLRCQTFPDDYRIVAPVSVRYVCGMSVPPLMMQRISGEVARQLFQINPV